MSKCITLLLACCAVALGSRGGDNSGEISWDKLPGHVVQISAKGDELWAVNEFDFILRWTGSAWSHPNGWATHVAASPDGRAWSTNKANHAIQRHDGNGGWQGIAGGLSNINAISAESCVAVNANGHMYKWAGGWVGITHPENNNRMMAIGEGGVIYKIDNTGNLFRFESGAWSKQEQPELAQWLDVQNSNRLVLTDHENRVWLFNGKDWGVVGGQHCQQATIGNKFIFCLDFRGHVWRVEM